MAQGNISSGDIISVIREPDAYRILASEFTDEASQMGQSHEE